MAQIVVYGHAASLRPRIRELSDAIHEAATTALELPPSQRFHRFVPLDPDCFLTPPDRSQDYTVIEVSMFEGRSLETKQALIRELYRTTTAIGLSAHDVEITITETPRSNWGIRGVPGDEVKLSYPVEGPPVPSPGPAAVRDEQAGSGQTRQRVSSGAPWEPVVGYSRAVRVGPWVVVAGTTAALEGGGAVGGRDLGAQTREALRRIEAALHEAGAELRHVVRTRMFVTDISRWQEVAQVHGEVFGSIRPVTTMVEVSNLIDPALLVEIEADAVVV